MDPNIPQDDQDKDTSFATEPQTVDHVAVLTSLEEMIKNNIDRVDRIRVELKKEKEMFDDNFKSSPIYLENEKQAKEVSKAVKTTRSEIMKQPAVVQQADKIKSMRMELAEIMRALSDYLLEYQRLTNGTVDQIEGHDGKPRRIINSAKVVVDTQKTK